MPNDPVTDDLRAVATELDRFTQHDDECAGLRFRCSVCGESMVHNETRQKQAVVDGKIVWLPYPYDHDYKPHECDCGLEATMDRLRALLARPVEQSRDDRRYHLARIAESLHADGMFAFEAACRDALELIDELARPVEEPQRVYEKCGRCEGRIVIGQRAAALLEAEGIPARSLEHISDRDITEADIQRIRELGEKFNWRERIEARRGSVKEQPIVPSASSPATVEGVTDDDCPNDCENRYDDECARHRKWQKPHAPPEGWPAEPPTNERVERLEDLLRRAQTRLHETRGWCRVRMNDHDEFCKSIDVELGRSHKEKV